MIWAGIVRWLHLLAATFWVGGQLFLVAVVLPVLRRRLPETEQVVIAALMGRRFGVLSAGTLGILLVTGPLIAVAHGVSWDILRNTDWGHVLLAKSALVAAVLVTSTVHGVYYGRRLERLAGTAGAPPTGMVPQHAALRRRSVRLSAVTLGLSLAIVGLAAWLATLP